MEFCYRYYLFWIDFSFSTLFFKKKTAPLDDRSGFVMRMSTPEEAHLMKIYKSFIITGIVDDSIQKTSKFINFITWIWWRHHQLIVRIYSYFTKIQKKNHKINC